MTAAQLALIFFTICLLIATILYLRPGLFLSLDNTNEGFTTIAVDDDKSPKCFARSAEAQELLQIVGSANTGSPSSAGPMAYQEFKLILQKALCMDADITGMGMGVYATYALPFSTMHDIEPAASFVGRCVRNAIRSQDIEVAFDKFQTRGNELIEQMCNTKESKARAFTIFHSILANASRNIATNCLRPHASMDVPPGVRDPGYYAPPSLSRLSEYTEYGRN